MYPGGAAASETTRDVLLCMLHLGISPGGVDRGGEVGRIFLCTNSADRWGRGGMWAPAEEGQRGEGEFIGFSLCFRSCSVVLFCVQLSNVPSIIYVGSILSSILLY